jgi:hypothetical protein
VTGGKASCSATSNTSGGNASRATSPSDALSSSRSNRCRQDRGATWVESHFRSCINCVKRFYQLVRRHQSTAPGQNYTTSWLGTDWRCHAPNLGRPFVRRDCSWVRTSLSDGNAKVAFCLLAHALRRQDDAYDVEGWLRWIWKKHRVAPPRWRSWLGSRWCPREHIFPSRRRPRFPFSERRRKRRGNSSRVNWGRHAAAFR